MKGQKKALRTTHAEDWGGTGSCWMLVKELPATFYTCSQQPFQISVYLPDFKVNSCSLCWCVGPSGPGNGWSIWLWFFFCGVVAFGGKIWIKICPCFDVIEAACRETSKRETEVTSCSSSHQGMTPYTQYKPELPVTWCIFIMSASLDGILQTCYTYFREKN